ncbi:MAG: glycosyl hydrolase family 65 protein [Myxococcota bacterium]
MTRDPARRDEACGCPRLRAIVSRERRQLLPEREYPADPWRLVERRSMPAYRPQTETLFSTANGYLGIRATPEEGAPVHERGTYLNGFHETWPIPYAEEAHGFPRLGQTMLAVPDGTLLKLYVDDEPFELANARLLAFERVLDFRRGTLDRELHFETPDGRRLCLRSSRFASMDDRHLACIEYEVRMVRGTASVVVSSELVVPSEQPRSDGVDPRRTSEVGDPALAPTHHRTRGRRILMNLETRSSHLRMACAMDHVVEADGPLEVEEAECARDRGRVVFHADLAEGQRLRIVKLLAYHYSAEADAGELRFRTHRTLDRALRHGVEVLRGRHRARIDAYWRLADVEVVGDAEVQQALRFNLYQLLQACGRCEGHGVPAKGLTGLGYQGHYFWDTEIHVVPFLTYVLPHTARSLLDLRHRQLPLARLRAREVGERGALFPWRTINGEESSAYYAASTAQYHIDADVVYAADRYVALTGDVEFLSHGFVEIAVETARMWAGLGFYSPRKGGRFCINGVTGPDEYNTVVNNNAYTNLMARENLRIAVRLVDSLRVRAPEAFDRLVGATGLDVAELEEWTRAADRMYVPWDEEAGVHLQDDDFLDRELWDFDGSPKSAYPLLLHFHPLVIYRHQVVKQADLVLATFLLPDAFDREEKRRIFDYYDPLTTGDSSLSGCIQSIMAAELGYREQAYLYFTDALVMDLGDIGGNVRDGLHVAALGGTWMAVVHGFAGLRDRDGVLRFRPDLPDGWDRLRFRLAPKGGVLEVEMQPGQTIYRLLEGEALEIRHDDERVVLDARNPSRVVAASARKPK